jgi:hypothetical protein
LIVFRLGPQNRQLRFVDLGLKITATISLFMSQNQADYGLSVAPQNRWSEVSVGHTSRSGGLLHLKASYAKISQSDLKTVRGATTGGARGIIVKVASSES